MKIHKFLCLVLLFTGCFLGKSQSVTCGYQTIDSLVAISDTGYANRKIQFENQWRDTTQFFGLDSLFARSVDVNATSVLIPVVFHNLGLSSLSAQQAQLFITALNGKFRDTNGPGADTQIEFCLAKIDPSGNQTNGVTFQNDVNNNGPFCVSDEQTFKSIIYWDQSEYLNVWVCNLFGCHVTSWGTPPAQYFKNPATKYMDGVVVDISLLNNSTFNIYPIVEQIGHWLSLLHTFGNGGACGTSQNDDGVSDTPACSGHANKNYPSCTPYPAGCTSTRQINNYMDDCNDACEDMFTVGQKSRMHFCILNERPNISDLGTISQCGSGYLCQNGLLDIGESGVDCGGLCTACSGQPPYCDRVVSFKINDQKCDVGNFVNLCPSESINISAYNYIKNCTPWGFNWLEIRRETGEPEIYADNCSHRIFKGVWACTYYQLYISFVECDQNKNPIGTEIGKWFNFPEVLNSFDVKEKLSAMGINLASGGYYRLRLSANNRTFTGYFKTFQSTRNLANTAVVVDEYADYVNYNSCTVYSAKTVAKYEIKTTGESRLASGHYYIDSYNCSQLPSFRQVSGTTSTPVVPVHRDFRSNTEVVPNSAISNSKLSQDFTIKLVPNPTEGLVRIVLDNASEPARSIGVFDISGNLIYSETNIKQKEIELNLSHLAPGLYVIKTDYQGQLYNTKLVVQ